MKDIIYGFGYLAKLLVNEKIVQNYEVIKDIDELDDYNLNDIKRFWFFASPPDDKEENQERLLDSLFDLDYIAQILPETCELIFASSEAVTVNDNSYYASIKRSQELILKLKSKNFTILRIPRVYGQNKKKGIFEKIKNGTLVKKVKKIHYISENDFCEWISSIIYTNIFKNTIEHYHRVKRIIKIKELIKLVLKYSTYKLEDKKYLKRGQKWNQKNFLKKTLVREAIRFIK